MNYPIAERQLSGVVTPQQQQEEGEDGGPASLSLADEAAQAVREHELERCAPRAGGGRAGWFCGGGAAHLTLSLVHPSAAPPAAAWPLRADAPPRRGARRRSELLIGKRISAGSFALVYAGRYRKEAREQSAPPASERWTRVPRALPLPTARERCVAPAAAARAGVPPRTPRAPCVAARAAHAAEAASARTRAARLCRALRRSLPAPPPRTHSRRCRPPAPQRHHAPALTLACAPRAHDTAPQMPIRSWLPSRFYARTVLPPRTSKRTSRRCSSSSPSTTRTCCASWACAATRRTCASVRAARQEAHCACDIALGFCSCRGRGQRRAPPLLTLARCVCVPGRAVTEFLVRGSLFDLLHPRMRARTERTPRLRCARCRQAHAHISPPCSHQAPGAPLPRLQPAARAALRGGHRGGHGVPAQLRGHPPRPEKRKRAPRWRARHQGCAPLARMLSPCMRGPC
jgi:hypothetical protein